MLRNTSDQDLGKEETRQKNRLNDNMSDISDNLSYVAKDHKTTMATITPQKDLSDDGESNALTNNVTHPSRFKDDQDLTNATDFKGEAHHTMTISKKLQFEESKFRASDEEVNLKENPMRNSNRFFGKVQLLGKKKKVAKPSKLGKGLLLLQPGPRLNVGLLNTKDRKYFKNPFS
jgi:hypothetical protein